VDPEMMSTPCSVSFSWVNQSVAELLLSSYIKKQADQADILGTPHKNESSKPDGGM